MPKTKISEYSVTNSDNTDIESINIAEGCAPSGINNAIRELMVHLKEFQTGASGDAFTFAGGVLISGTANTITGNVLMSGTNTITGSTTATFAAGAVGTPSIAAHGDTNTGIFFPAADTIAFTEGGAEAMRIDSSGNVGIGTTSPGAKLDVSGAVRGQQVIATTANPGHAASRALLSYGSNTASLWSYGADSSTLGSISFETRSSNGSLGQTIATFNQYGLGLGTAVPSSGIGICFPATQSASSNANTLDDYEEGTWTPTVRGESSAGTTTYTTQLGYYTKIGNTVHLYCSVAYSAATGTGTLQIKGLPFNNVDRVTMGAVRTSDLNLPNTSTWIVTAFQDTSGTIVFNGSGDDVGATEVALSNESAGIIFQITYRV